MGDGVSIDTGPVARVAAQLEATAAGFADPARLLAEVAAAVRRYATPRTPRATGALAGSLATDRGTVDGNPAALLTWAARYAVFVNFGTRVMPGRPFATDALTAATGDADRLLADWATDQLP